MRAQLSVTVGEQAALFSVVLPVTHRAHNTLLAYRIDIPTGQIRMST